ncbi:phycocyanobilin:ferredoxin oxidoreductase [Cyanobium sp. WAJ14-Wanaka]|uniref:phycocyanobilin:ferredoxin oxidoreductase n=1 Tax=Cyanobium sp. WAJ14-Wanaka TaxID=2823725 RepID=UPI0020CF942A|nr:phycocyanobilin:ferredoxin oxidoreductase [Cyanobium sp. WAJ14-Wanaka]
MSAAPSPRPLSGKGSVHPLVDALAGQIRHRWQSLPGLEELSIDPELEEITGQLDGNALFISNELRRCHGLRKLHLETARLGVGLQILHCVLFPDPCFDLPVFGADIVAGPAGISAAIVDLSPVCGKLPPLVDEALARRPARSYSQRRELPPWGSIFSPHVCFVRPSTVEEEGWFIDEVGDFIDALASAIDGTSPDAPDAPASIERWRGQLRYCQQQKQNDKTRRVLEKAFNPAWADRYIEELLFDDPLPPV